MTENKQLTTWEHKNTSLIFLSILHFFFLSVSHILLQCIMSVRVSMTVDFSIEFKLNIIVWLTNTCVNTLFVSKWIIIFKIYFEKTHFYLFKTSFPKIIFFQSQTLWIKNWNFFYTRCRHFWVGLLYELLCITVFTKKIIINIKS